MQSVEIMKEPNLAAWFVLVLREKFFASVYNPFAQLTAFAGTPVASTIQFCRGNNG